MGCGLGLLGLALFFLGVIGKLWFLIVIGLYGIGVLATPANPTYELRFKNQKTTEDIQRELEALVRKIRRRVSQEVLKKVVSIRDSILDMLPHIVDISSSDYAISTIRQTALDYLPETLENYLNLPPAFRQMHPVRDGKTSRQAPPGAARYTRSGDEGYRSGLLSQRHATPRGAWPFLAGEVPESGSVV